MKDLLELQKAEFVKNGIPSYNDRVDVLKRCIALIETHDEQIIEALNQDFQNRSRTEIITSEISQTIRNLNFSIKNLKKWMKPQRRSSSFMADTLGARSYMLPSPLGSVGVIAPWNFPVGMVFYPAASIFAVSYTHLTLPTIVSV